MTLKLTNNVTKVEYTWDVVDECKSGHFWAFSITLPDDISDGEYSYELYDDGLGKIATGLCQVGDYVKNKQTYKNNEKKTITYNG